MQKCNFIETGTCVKKKCEVNLFLNEFVKKRYDVSLKDIGFECLDISGSDGKRPEISFVHKGQKIVIEAKTLHYEEINILNSFTNKIGELLIDFCKENKTNGKLIKRTSEIMGVNLAFDETILSLAPILNNKSNISEQKDLIYRIINSTYNKLKSMKKRGEWVGSICLDISKYKKLRMKDLKTVKKNLYERAAISGFENTDPDWLKHSFRTEEYIRNDIKKLNILINFVDESSEITFSSAALDSTFIASINHIEKLIKSAEEKFNSYNNEYKKVLFFNNDFIRLKSEINDGYEEIIQEINSKIINSVIDEVWIEFIDAIIEHDHFDYIETSSEGRKGYEMIYPVDTDIKRYL
ncbi:hypothetical protein [Paenibacillus castaneae]|uniref:hypothetical protein n=1 Tax=Paenibacillus castaneae TaxID=474957 RepID=UPI001ABA3D8A|nr:hypothetical protein [Paenibacillus castaneae]